MGPNGSRHAQNGSKWNQGTKWDLMGPNGYKWAQMEPKGLQWDQKGSNGTKGARPKRDPKGQNGTKWASREGGYWDHLCDRMLCGNGAELYPVRSA